ncbi:hypothetical protein niasHT_018944 [Heterodera trifolii]|uniref:guanylate cyclase n=1 Tax=Heterodera trifolii TaxID=157864 RepID=A0ABD2LDV6_9BILA
MCHCFFIFVIGAALVTKCQTQQTMPGNSVIDFTTPSTPVSNQTLIKIAILTAQNDTDFGLPRKNSALRDSGGAIPMALEQLWADQILPKNVNFSFQWTYENCNEATALGLSYQYIRDFGADAIIATPCIDVPPTVGHLAANFNIPMMVWGQSMVSKLAASNNATYPSLLNIVPNYKYMASGLISLFQYFNWTQFAVVIQSDTTSVNGGCYFLGKDIDRALSEQSKVTLTYKARINDIQSSYTNTIVTSLKKRARINLSRLPFWVQRRSNNSIVLDGRDADAEAIGRLFFWWHYDITLSSLSNRNYYGFYERVVNRTYGWPFYCPESDCGTVVNGSVYSILLYDTIYNYGIALNESFKQFGIRPEVYRNGSLLASYRKPFMGLSGYAITESDRNTRVLVLSNRRTEGSKNAFRILMQLAWKDGELNITMRAGSSPFIWSSHGGSAPLAVPRCGFDGNGCAVSVFDMYKGYFLSGIALFALLIITSVTIIVYLIHAKIVETRKNNLLWKIPFGLLKRQKQRRPERTERSQHSLRSNQTNLSSLTHSTTDSLAQSKTFTLYSYNGEKCIVRTYCSTSLATMALSVAQMAECRTLRLFDHENLNRFLGLSLDGPNVLAVWNFCARGSLKDVIMSENAMVRDVMFIQSAINELCEGLYFLHSSLLQFHGRLKSSVCLINDRWQVKISYFGLRWLKNVQKIETKDLLWLAPEQLRKMGDNTNNNNNNDQQMDGSKQSDIYTLALIFTEVCIIK